MKNKMATSKRRRVYSKTHGRCFYCGLPLEPDGASMEDVHGHDWLLPQLRQCMTVDHKIPTQRGGSDDIEDLNPACGCCNSRKGLSTVEEFRLRLGLQNRTLPYYFMDEDPPACRDFIVVTSPAFVRSVMIHSFPDAYAHRKYPGGWGR